jgi:hypothetical protein
MHNYHQSQLLSLRNYCNCPQIKEQFSPKTIRQQHVLRERLITLSKNIYEEIVRFMHLASSNFFMIKRVTFAFVASLFFFSKGMGTRICPYLSLCSLAVVICAAIGEFKNLRAARRHRRHDNISSQTHPPRAVVCLEFL